MAIRTRVAIGGSGRPYAGFGAKNESTSHPAVNITRAAIGGSGRNYRGFVAKGEAEGGGDDGPKYIGFHVDIGRFMR